MGAIFEGTVNLPWGASGVQSLWEPVESVRIRA